MRIVAGENRGLQLADIGRGDPAAHLRPTADRVRESLFNVLTGGRHGSPVAGAQVLDLFAGTGALAFEALSRGAAAAVLVDNGRVAGRILRDNLARTRRDAQVTILAHDATVLPPNSGPQATLVFVDPPYGKGLGQRALAAARASGWIAPGALIVWEENAEQDPPDGFTRIESRRYGETVVTLLAAS